MKCCSFWNEFKPVHILEWNSNQDYYIVKGESQFLLRLCDICLFARLAQKNAWNAVDISSIYSFDEKHNIVSWNLPFSLKGSPLTSKIVWR